MTFAFVCPNCGKHRDIDKALQGKKIRCTCGQTVRLPIAESSQRSNSRGFSDPLPAAGNVHGTFMDPFDEGHVSPLPVRHGPGHEKQGFGNGLQNAPYAKGSIIRLMMAMAAGTLAILFAFFVCFVVSFLVMPTFGAPRSNFPGFPNGMRDISEQGYWGIQVAAWAAIIIGIVYGIAGIVQFVGAWIQFVRRERVMAWIDVLVSAVSVIFIIVIAAFFFYLNYQIFEVKRVHSSAVDIGQSSTSGMNSQEQERFNEQQKEVGGMISGTHWLLFRQCFVLAIIPAVVLSLSMVRVLRN